MHRRLALVLTLLPAVGFAGPFATVTNPHEGPAAISNTTVPAAPGGVAPVRDARDTLNLPPPPLGVPAPVGGRIGQLEPIETPIPPSITEPAPVPPPLAKKPVAQSITQAAPGILVVRPAPLDDEPPLTRSGTLRGSMFSDRTETLTPQGVVDDQPDPKGTFSFGGGDAYYLPSEQAPTLAASPLPDTGEVAAETVAPETASPTTSEQTTANEALPVVIISPTAEVSPAQVMAQAVPVSATQPLAQPIAGSVSFMADALTPSGQGKKQLAAFIRLAKGAPPLAQLRLTQRTVAPAGALSELAAARRTNLLAELKRAGVIDAATRIHEVRVRAATPQSKVTLVGMP